MMRLKRQPIRRQHETIITLVDVVFFLLVFFMLIGRMDAGSPFEILPPLSPHGEALPSGGATISLASDGRLALDGQARERPALLEELREAADGQADPLFVRINADAEAPVRHLLTLLTALQDLAGENLVLVVTPERK